jgi:hypothetical protein
MRALFVGILIIASGLGALAQSKTDTCSFLKKVRFKNGRDTIVVKAVLLDFLLAPPRFIEKKTPNIYKYKFGSDILFQPENCGNKYEKPVLSSKSVDGEGILNGSNLGATIYLTCIVFDESILDTGEYDCLVIRVSRKKPVNFK